MTVIRGAVVDVVYSADRLDCFQPGSALVRSRVAAVTVCPR